MSVRERLVGASLTQRPFAERLPRRRRKTAWVTAVVAPVLLTLGQRALGSSVPPATGDEVASLLETDGAFVAQLEPGGFFTILAAGGARADEFVVGERLWVEPHMAVAEVLRTGQPGRIDDYARASPGLKARVESMG